MGLLSGKTALVTGAARGIGKAIALKFAEEGANIAFTDLVIDENGEATKAEIEAKGVKCIAYASNAADFAQTEEVVKQVHADFGSIDILVNNAGVAPTVRADLLEMGEESFERLIRTNLQGPFFLTQAVAKRMLANPSTDAAVFRCIINIGSVSADYASVNRGEYCLSKAGVAMATKLWAVRLADAHIPVYELRPGVIRSDMTAVVTEKYDKLIADGLTLQRRWGTPADIGRAVAMLATGSLAYSTGEVIHVDGGLSVLRF